MRCITIIPSSSCCGMYEIVGLNNSFITIARYVKSIKEAFGQRWYRDMWSLDPNTYKLIDGPLRLTSSLVQTERLISKNSVESSFTVKLKKHIEAKNYGSVHLCPVFKNSKTGKYIQISIFYPNYTKLCTIPPNPNYKKSHKLRTKKAV